MKFLDLTGLQHFYDKYLRPLKDAAFKNTANNLTTETEGSVLDARQGKALNDLKLSIAKVIAKSIGIMALAQILLFSVIAITRIPIGRLTIPMVILVYLLTLFGITTKFEKDLSKKKLEENKNKSKKK